MLASTRGPEPKIVIATIARPRGRTGVQTHFNTFLDYIRAQGTEAILVTPFSYHGAIARLVFALRPALGKLSPSLMVWWYETWHYLFLKMALKRLLKKAGPVVVYAQCPISAKAAMEARVSAQQRVIMAVHFNVSQADEWATQVGLSRSGIVYRKIRQREQDVLPRLDGLVHVSNFARDSVLAAVPAASQVRSAVLPNFVSRLEDGSGGSLLGDLVSIGSLEPRKNQAFLLDVLAHANQLGKRYTLTLIGDGPDRAKLEALAASTQVSGQVAFLGFRENARHLLSRHRVFVHSALQENLPLAIIEAMASGLPVCAAPIGGIPDVLRNGIEGVYWDLADARDGANKLIALMEDSARQQRMSEAAASRFADFFETSKVANQLERFLLSTL